METDGAFYPPWIQTKLSNPTANHVWGVESIVQQVRKVTKKSLNGHLKMAEQVIKSYNGHLKILELLCTEMEYKWAFRCLWKNPIHRGPIMNLRNATILLFFQAAASHMQHCVGVHIWLFLALSCWIFMFDAFALFPHSCCCCSSKCISLAWDE